MATLEELTSAERGWVAERLADAARLCGVTGTGGVTPELLDEAWSEALSGNGPGEPNFLVNAVGIAFGQILVSEHGFRWVIATDDYGTDLAIVAAEGTGNVLVYPANFVAKRFENRRTRFVAESIRSIAADVRRIAGH